MTDHERPPCQGDSLADLCYLLGDERSQEVVAYFRSADTDVATLEALAEHAVGPGDARADRRRTKIRLHHVTLPKLAEANVLEYDSRQRDVRYLGCDYLESAIDWLPAEGIAGD